MTGRSDPYLVGLILNPVRHREHQQNTRVSTERIDAESLFSVQFETQFPISRNRQIKGLLRVTIVDHLNFDPSQSAISWCQHLSNLRHQLQVVIYRHLDMDCPFRLEISRSAPISEQGNRVRTWSDLIRSCELGIEFEFITNLHLDTSHFDSGLVSPNKV